MNRQRVFLTSVFAIALGFGIWTVAAVTFQGVSSSFTDGDVVSAAEFNDLFGRIDSNFSDAATQINTNESEIAALQTEKLDASGGTVSGMLTIDGGDGGAAFFQNNSDTDPTLYLKNTGTGPLLQAVTPSGGVLEVSTDGSVRIGGTASNPVIRLDGTAGTVTNSVGSGLPLAFGTIGADGSILSGTSNFAVTYEAGLVRYRISIDGESVLFTEYTALATPGSGAIGARIGSESGDLLVHLKDAAGANVQGGFNFVIFKAGS